MGLTSLPKNDFIIINELATIFKKKLDKDFEIKVKNNSICLGRMSYDNYSTNKFRMVSCICSANICQQEFSIIDTEQVDQENKTRKYSIKLCDSKKTIGQYDLDLKRGFHKHDFSNGKKDHNHIKLQGDLSVIVDDIINQISV